MIIEFFPINGESNHKTFIYWLEEILEEMEI